MPFLKETSCPFPVSVLLDHPPILPMIYGSDPPRKSPDEANLTFISVIFKVFAWTFFVVRSSTMSPICFPSLFFNETVFFPEERPYSGHVPLPRTSSLIRSLSYAAKIILFSFGSA